MSLLKKVLAALVPKLYARPGAAAVRPAAPLSRPLLTPGVSAATAHRYGARITEGGNPPDNWGRSAARAQMVRQNRLRSLHRARFESRRKKGGRKCTAAR
jgi:hypothetical protein